jgi:hypothetical protein
MITQMDKEAFRARMRRHSVVNGTPLVILTVNELNWLLDTIDELEIEVAKKEKHP